MSTDQTCPSGFGSIAQDVALGSIVVLLVVFVACAAVAMAYTTYWFIKEWIR